MWPVVLEDDSGTSVIGSVVEPGGNLLVVIGAEASSDGETVTVRADVHSGLKAQTTRRTTRWR